MVYTFVKSCGFLNSIDEATADALYCGIVTDTGSFKFASTTKETHAVVADLLERGARNAFIHEKLFDSNSIDRIKLLGYTLNKMQVHSNFETAILALSTKEMLQFNCRKGDTEGLVNYALSMNGIRLAVFFKEGEDIVKISFRSKGDFYVNELARDHFNGGGHKNAAGGSSRQTLDETIETFKKLFPDLIKYKHE